MDSQARDKYPSILEEDWVELGYQRGDDPGLAEKIHPIFQRTNASRPPGSEHIWPQYKSETDYGTMYDKMGVILQMASNMLVSPQSLDFLYQVARSPRRDSDKGPSKQDRPCKEFGWAKPPSKSMIRQHARNALNRLAHSLTFQVGDSEANPGLGSDIAQTKWTYSTFRSGVKLNDLDEAGIASKITLNSAFLLQLITLDREEEDTTDQKMSLQVKIAMTICHEIAHALAYAVNWELFEMIKAETDAADQARMEGREYPLRTLDVDEPFYRDEKQAEIGDCWENQVFGGKVSWSGDINDSLHVSRWPSFLTRGKGNPARGKEEHTARQYVVNMHFIRNMHLQSFWDGVKPHHQKALYIKKRIGIEYLNPDTEDAVSTNSSETRWPRDADSGRVSREQNGQPVQDPSGTGANKPAAYW